MTDYLLRSLRAAHGTIMFFASRYERKQACTNHPNADLLRFPTGKHRRFCDSCDRNPPALSTTELLRCKRPSFRCLRGLLTSGKSPCWK